MMGAGENEITSMPSSDDPHTLYKAYVQFLAGATGIPIMCYYLIMHYFQSNNTLFSLSESVIFKYIPFLGSGIATATGFPMDTVKTRIQINPELHPRALSCLRSLVRSSGVPCFIGTGIYN